VGPTAAGCAVSFGQPVLLLFLLQMLIIMEWTAWQQITGTCFAYCCC
jgi:hypothetical protein